MSVCEFLYDLLPTSADKVQAWAAVITAGIAGAALASWRHQKYYDIYLQALSQYQLHHATLINTISEQRQLLKDTVNLEQYLDSSAKLELRNTKRLLECKFHATYATLKQIHKHKNQYNELYKLYEIYMHEINCISIEGIKIRMRIFNELFTKRQNTGKDMQTVLEGYNNICKEAAKTIGLATYRYNMKFTDPNKRTDATEQLEKEIEAMG